MSRIFNSKQACKFLAGIHPRTLRKWIKAGIVKPLTINGRNYFEKDELVRNLKSRNERQTSSVKGIVDDVLNQMDRGK